VRHHPEHPLHAEVTHPYDEYVQEIMEVGNVWERETSIALQRAYGNLLHWEQGDPALRVGNERWLGHLDFFVEECRQFPCGTVIEHKATNPDNFVKKGRLPYQFHFDGTGAGQGSRPPGGQVVEHWRSLYRLMQFVRQARRLLTSAARRISVAPVGNSFGQ